MSRCGDIYENRVTGEYAVVLRGSEDRGDGPGIAHLTARPGAAVVGEHFHPFMREKFIVLKGTLDARVAGRTMSLSAGEQVVVEPFPERSGRRGPAGNVNRRWRGRGHPRATLLRRNSHTAHAR